MNMQSSDLAAFGQKSARDFHRRFGDTVIKRHGYENVLIHVKLP
jgi:hypothetical protein